MSSLSACPCRCIVVTLCCLYNVCFSFFRISFSSCYTNHYFYCYGGSSQSTITFVSIYKDWDEAKQYCNDHYVDLVILKEDEQFKALPVGFYYIWTDIHRDGPGKLQNFECQWHDFNGICFLFIHK